MENLHQIIQAIRSFPGVTRKNTIHEIVKLLPTDSFVSVAASEGEDAAAIEFGNDYILFAKYPARKGSDFRRDSIIPSVANRM